MTIGIGVLCSTKPKPHQPRPDSLVLIADTMGSTDVDSTDELHKMWLNDELRLYAVGAGTLDYGGEIFVIIENELKEQFKQGQPRTHGVISGVLNKAFQLHRAQHFQWDIVWGKFNMPNVGMLADPALLREEWEKFSVNIQMIVGIPDATGQMYLYLIAQFEGMTKVVHLAEFPGYCAIGSGGNNAQFWLHYRSQVLGRSVKQSIYQAYEAKRMAASAPTVNDKIEIAIVLPGMNAFHLNEDTPAIDDCPVSLPELERMFKKYGPQDTSSLAHPKSLPLAGKKQAGLP